ncbi:SRPBCC family protein [Cellulomonas bogoriensis]|uniref:ATPase n=1 Tax=Cellulomonas bogoriensis 69B4 = DSM 16987 TaxID=1386082 RepID=A0A0A0C1Y4_9CELL|nr:SRPBCC family protein [Cellulomonas bogoriensis]KGM13997.1 ATPase [Cellulomonas bogoriensis 69B4 = DSM 16987]
MVRALGQVVRRGERFDIEMERVYGASVQDVWSAVTERERLGRWLADYVGDLELGGRWQAIDGDDGEVFCSGTVTECDPPRRYVTTWEYDGEPGSVVEVTVGSHPEGAVLRLVHTGLTQSMYAPGWQAFLEQLDALLGPAPSCEVDPDRLPGVDWATRFTELKDVWAARVDGA